MPAAAALGAWPEHFWAPNEALRDGMGLMNAHAQIALENASREKIAHQLAILFPHSAQADGDDQKE